MNRVCLIGRLTTKPELRYTSQNLAFTRFSIAVNRITSGENKVDFISIIVWRKLAENVCQYLDKGSQISVEGRIQTGSYTDKDGNRRYTTDVVAEHVQFLERKKSASTPYDYENENISTKETETDPFADFGEQVSMDDNFLE